MFAISILLHKGSATMSLAISLSKAFPEKDCFVFSMVAVFALFAPIGIGIGMAVAESSAITGVVFNCLAAGTLIYIACNEVIVEEFKKPEAKGWKFLFFFLGIAIITCLLLIPAEHAH